MCLKWSTKKRAPFVATMFIARFGKLLLAKYSLAKENHGTQKTSTLYIFRVFNFRGLCQPRKYFDNENFQIYGIYVSHSVCQFMVI